MKKETVLLAKDAPSSDSFSPVNLLPKEVLKAEN